MGQTLTHGIYLPDEGERNCYNGLAANWQLLDGAVGTITQHTTQIAGKAPLVHTHVKADITDFPAYGNAAGTICEGNDSRLSDARTPVAHTHGKADITDLFNSANTWTNTNTFQQNITYERTNLFHQAVNPCYFLKDTELKKGSLAPTTHSAYAGNWQDQNSTNLGYMRFVEYDTGKQTVEIRVSNLFKNGALDPTGSTVNCTVNLELQPSGEKSLIPEQNNDINLGTSTNKWKTLNGINPGALSLPSSDSADYIDLSSNLSTNAEYLYTAPYDGWLCLYVNVNEFFEENAIGLYRSDTSANSHQWAKSVTAAVNLYKQNRYQGSVMLPVESGKKYICYISLNANATIHSKYLFFYKNKGNV